MAMDTIVNKVSESGLVTIDLERLYPVGERVVLDISHMLVEGLLLREKDFRAYIADNDWSKYTGCYVALCCTTDAIVPQWAWMLLASALQPYAKKTVLGDLQVLETVLFEELVRSLPDEEFRGQRVIIKGCSKLPVPVQAYVALTARLQPLVRSIMYGEPCSTVPVYKQPKA